MDILPLIPEIKALGPSGQLENRSQRPPFPFTAGQILQATVSSQDAPNLFTLKLGGQELSVETSTLLQAGQTLSVKVATLSPQLQLQVVEPPLTDQRISTALHSMINQGKAFSQISSLTDPKSQTTQLSSTSQDVLLQMRTNLSGLSAGSNQINSLVAQIVSALLTSASSNQAATTSNKAETVSQLLQQLASHPELSAKLRESATDLAKSVLAEKNSFGITPSQAPSATILSSLTTNETSLRSELLQQITLLNPSLQTMLQPLVVQLGQTSWLGENRQIEQILQFLVQAGGEVGSTEKIALDGQQLQQTLQKLGLNLEQLLAKGIPSEAASTLKFALLELANNLSTNGSKLQKIDEILNSIQFSQLAQMRLSQESLFFLPLPFPFLQSGFLLINSENKSENSNPKKKNKDAGDNDVSMYLQLEGLGNLQISIRQEKDKIALTFYSQDAERANFIEKYKEELQDMLTTGSLYSAHFLIGAKEPVKILIEKMLHAPTGMVNTLA